MTLARHTLAPGAMAASFGLVLSLTLARNAGFSLGLPLDDAWIHAAFARHLAESARWGLFAGQRSGGETSLLWPALLAIAERVRPGSAPSVALLLGGGCWLVLPGLVGTFARTPRRGQLLALAVGACGPLLFLALSGMETIPALLLGLLAIARVSSGDLTGGALAAGVATALRPDGVLLLPALLIGGVAHERGRIPVGPTAKHSGSPGAAWGRTLRAMAPGLALCLTSVVLLAAVEGRFPPSTLGGRRWIEGLGVHPSATGGLPALVRLVIEWGRALSADLGWGRIAAEHPFAGGQQLRWIWRGVAASAMVGGGVLVAARALRYASDAEEEGSRRAEGMLLSWTALVLLAYAVILPARGHLGRYQPQVFVVFLMLLVEGIAWFAALPRGRAAARGAAAVCAAVVAGGLVVGWITAGWLWGRAVATVDSVHVRAARELTTLLPPGARLAVFDVGAAAYFYRDPMVDLSGLSDPEVAALLPRGDLAPLLRQRGVGFLLMPQLGAQGAQSLAARLGLLPHEGFALEPIASWTAGQGLWGQAFNYSGNVFPRLQLFEIAAPTTSP